MKKQSIEPLGENLLVEIEIKTHTAKGLALPDSHDYINEKAIVLAVGPDVKDKRITVGSVVFFPSWALKTHLYDDKKADCVEESKCSAVIRK